MSSTGKMLVRGASVRVVANFVQMAVALGLTPYVFDVLGDHQYGLWVLVGSLLGVYGLLDLGVSSAVSRFTSRAMAREDEDEFHGYFATSVWILVGLGLAVFAATFFLATIASQAAENPADERVAFGIVMILGSVLALSFPGHAFVGLLAAHLRYDLVSTMQIVTTIARVPLVVLAFESGGRLLALAGCFAFLTVINMGGVAFFARRVHEGLTLRWRWVCRKKAREIFAYGFSTFLAQLADLMRWKLSPVIVTGFLGATTAGFFDFADKLNRIVGELSKSVMSVLAPVFSKQEGRGDVDAMRESFRFTTKIASYVAVLLGGMMILFGGAFLQRWVGTRFDFLVPILQVLVVGTIFAAAQMPTVQFLFGTSRHKTYAVNNIVHGVLVVGATCALIGPYGLMGVAIGSAAPTILMKFFVIPIPACRALEIPVRRFYLRDVVVPMLTPMPFLLTCAWLTHGWVEPSYLRVFVLSGASCLLFVPYIYAVGFTPAERHRLLSAFRRRSGAPESIATDPAVEDASTDAGEPAKEKPKDPVRT